MNYKLIAIDLDGTLLNRQKVVLPESILALRFLQDKGINTILVTGRHHIAARYFHKQVGLSSAVICCNGSYIYHPVVDTINNTKSLPMDMARRVITLLRANNIGCIAYADNVIIHETGNQRILSTRKWAETLPESERPGLVEVADLSASLPKVERIWKLLASSSDITSLDRVAALLSDENQVSCERSWQHQLDISAVGVSKGQCLQDYAASLGITPAQIVAIGDNENDLSMLRIAGLSVAMGNGCERLKNFADITIGDHNEPVIAKLLMSLVAEAAL